MKVSKNNGKSQKILDIKAISSKRLMSEIKQRLDDNVISRRDALELAGIGYCLDCSKGWGSVEKNGYCVNCNSEWKGLEKNVKKSSPKIKEGISSECV